MNSLTAKTLATVFASAVLLGLAGCQCDKRNKNNNNDVVQEEAPNYAVTCYSKDGTALLFNDTVHKVRTDEGVHYLYKKSSDNGPTVRIPTEGCFIKKL